MSSGCRQACAEGIFGLGGLPGGEREGRRVDGVDCVLEEWLGLWGLTFDGEYFPETNLGGNYACVTRGKNFPANVERLAEQRLCTGQISLERPSDANINEGRSHIGVVIASELAAQVPGLA